MGMGEGDGGCSSPGMKSPGSLTTPQDGARRATSKTRASTRQARRVPAAERTILVPDGPCTKMGHDAWGHAQARSVPELDKQGPCQEGGEFDKQEPCRPPTAPGWCTTLARSFPARHREDGTAFSRRSLPNWHGIFLAGPRQNTCFFGLATLYCACSMQQQ